MVKPNLNSGGSFLTFFLFEIGRMTLEMLWFLHAVSFSRTPPILITSPRVVISPVIARLAARGLERALEIRAAKRLTPAEGPSFGVAPIGTWR